MSHSQQPQSYSNSQVNHGTTVLDRYYEMTDGNNDASSLQVAVQVSTSTNRPSELAAGRPTSPTASSVSSLSAPSVAVNEHDAYMGMREAPSHDGGAPARSSTRMLLLQTFGVRLLGASLCWLLWDVAFYGNKLFQSTFLLALTGEETTSLLHFTMAATLNSFVALCGYFGAALLMDHPLIGRFRLQLIGFLLTGTLFVSVGFSYDNLSPTILVIMYLGSSFFGQLGPNATTFLIPAEIFPTEVRTLCHGIAAASGKFGALLASFLFNRSDKVLDLFLLSGYASFAACAITFWTIPESNGLDLAELDRKWRMIVNGRKHEYDGPANAPEFMSTHERQALQWAHRQRHGNDSHLEGIYDY